MKILTTCLESASGLLNNEEKNIITEYYNVLMHLLKC
jgi:hypothetical protein